MIKKTFAYLTKIILLTLICAFGYIFIQQNIKKEKYINFFGYTIFKIASGSMSGTIEKDDVILVKITKDVKKDDIISFEYENTIVTHRITELKDDELITKGDANNTEDEPISKDKVIGKVVRIFQSLGIWIKVFSDGRVLISIFMTLMFFSFILSFDKEKKNE